LFIRGVAELTLAACAPLEWSQRRNVKGVAVPALVSFYLQSGTDAWALGVNDSINAPKDAKTTLIL